MPDFSQVLLTVDFDRTLTAPDSSIPQRNIEAIEYFIANGGTFTVNTGRSVSSFQKYLETLPRNAPLLLYNGSATYDKGKVQDCAVFDLSPETVLSDMRRLFPDMNLEVQGARVHHLVDPTPEFLDFYDALGWPYEIWQSGTDLQPFIKFALYGKPSQSAISDMFRATPQEEQRFLDAARQISQLYAGKVEVFLAAPRIIDVHAKGVSKCASARALQKKLGKKILVCVGDAQNDVAMLDGADYAYCPADSIVAGQYETVCSCGDGAVADVIYKKIPAICEIQP